MNKLLLVLSVVIPFASLSPTEGEVPDEPYAHIAEIHVNGNGLTCVGVLYGKQCIITSAKCTNYCKNGVYIRTYNPSERRYTTNRVIDTFTNNPFFNVRDVGILKLRNTPSSFYLNDSLTLPNGNVKGELVYKSLRYSEEVNIETKKTCRDQHHEYFPMVGSICATQTGFREECYAPIGSPLFSNNKLVGIASWCENLEYNAEEYMVFTDLNDESNKKFLSETAWPKCQ